MNENKPTSEELMNQTVKDDNLKKLEAADAIKSFLRGKAERPDNPGTSPNSVTPEPSPTVPKENKNGKDVLEDQLKQAKRDLRRVEMSPEERYLDRLEEADIPIKKAREVIDKVVIQLQPWTETRNIVGDVNAVFRTRMPRDIERLRAVIEAKKPKFQATREFESAKYNIAASIVRYGEHKFSSKTDEDIEETVNWLRNIPYPVFNEIQKRLYEFDRDINIIFSEGYMENF